METSVLSIESHYQLLKEALAAQMYHGDPHSKMQQSQGGWNLKGIDNSASMTESAPVRSLCKADTQSGAKPFTLLHKFILLNVLFGEVFTHFNLWKVFSLSLGWSVASRPPSRAKAVSSKSSNLNSLG